MGERRKYMRFDVLMDAVSRKGEALRRFKVNNFSKEGLGLLAHKSFDLGEGLDVEVMIPGDNVPVMVRGEVAWTSAPSLDGFEHTGGIKFKKINNEDKSRILEYIYHKWIVPQNTAAK